MSSALQLADIVILTVRQCEDSDAVAAGHLIYRVLIPASPGVWLLSLVQRVWVYDANRWFGPVGEHSGWCWFDRQNAFRGWSDRAWNYNSAAYYCLWTEVWKERRECSLVRPWIDKRFGLLPGIIFILKLKHAAYASSVLRASPRCRCWKLSQDVHPPSFGNDRWNSVSTQGWSCLVHIDLRIKIFISKHLRNERHNTFSLMRSLSWFTEVSRICER